ncbi:hypothetical protein Tco_0103207 [Tanacetum coccineum]
MLRGALLVFDAVAFFHEAEAETVCRVQLAEKSKSKMKCPPTLSGARLDRKEGSIAAACKFIFEEVTTTFVVLLLKEISTASSHDIIGFKLWY